MTLKSNLSKEEMEILKNLKDDESIIIVPADKGKAVVVLDKLLYLQKMNDLLDDDYVEVERGDEKKLLSKLMRN